MYTSRLLRAAAAGIWTLALVACGEPEAADEAQEALPDVGHKFDVNLGHDAPANDVSVASPDADQPTQDADFLLPDPTQKCDANDDCDSGFCVLGPMGKVCAPGCVENCPLHWGCSAVQAAGGDVAYVCLPRYISLCNPCQEHKDCKELLQAGEAFCLDRGAAGSFCGGQCDPTGADPSASCPSGYICEPFVAPGGESVAQCRLQKGECACGDRAVEQALTTTCQVVNSHGACPGDRKCSPSGLTPCDGAAAQAEICNGLDDDCDGETDEGLQVQPCTNSNAHGVCPGLSACVDGKLGCEGPEPAVESCDGVDQDCDGQTDAGACDDGIPCTNDACDGAGGLCLHVPVPGPCDDGDLCTFGDVCVEGKCAAQPVTCDDKDGCTSDSCKPTAGCIHLPAAAGSKCDDGDPCTGEDACGQDGCVGTPANDGGPCDDGNACTNGDSCTLGVCAGKPLVCSDSNPCTDGVCVAGKGCVSAYNDALCDDGNPCTTGDQCAGGSCGGKGKKVCNDGNDCTTDTCAADAGGCAFTPTSGACDDGNACTDKDSCTKGGCIGTPLDCNDGNPCTNDVCTPGGANPGCAHVFNNVPCDDKDPCTIGDACKAGQCGAGAQLNCDDSNPCTVDTCAALSGCAHKPAPSACDDGNKCTSGDACDGGTCFGSKLANCDDGNSCTADGCHPKSGCLHQPAALNCDDGDPCSIGDVCAAGGCKAGTALKCVDGNDCTDDACKAGSGCLYVANQGQCNDGNACTTNDGCVAGACKPGKVLDCTDANPCTVEWCEAKVGCKSGLNTGSCDDGDKCTTNDLCKSGVCNAGPKANCADGNPCTDDSCEAVKGCQHKANSLPCKSDGKPCTQDICVSAACKHLPMQEGAKCDDGQVCTTSEVCKVGQCAGPIDKDTDGDGFIDNKCAGGKDCDDGDKARNPQAEEICDDKDNDCKGGVDEVCDTDNDGYCALGLQMPAGCVPNCAAGKDCAPAKCPKTCVNGATDCNDKASAIHPGANEKLDFMVSYEYVGGQHSIQTDNFDAGVGLDGAWHAAWSAYSRTHVGGNTALGGWQGQTNYHIFYARSTDTRTWVRETVWPTSDTIRQLAMAPGKQGQLAIAARTVQGGTVRLRVFQPTPTAWSEHTVLEKADIGDIIDAAMDPAGTTHIVHYAADTGDLLHSWGGGQKWTTETVDSQGDVGSYAAIAADAGGKLHVAYYDASKADLRYATGVAGQWSTTTISSQGAPGLHTSIALDGQGKVHIGHYELVGSDALYSTNAGGGWKTETVQSAGITGLKTSIAVTAAGVPAMSFHIAGSNTRARIANRAGGSWKVSDIKGNDARNYTRTLIDGQGQPRSIYWRSQYNHYALRIMGGGADDLVAPNTEGDRWSGGSAVLDGGLAAVATSREVPTVMWGQRTDRWRMHTMELPTTYFEPADGAFFGGAWHVCARNHWQPYGLNYGTNASGTWKFEAVDGGTYQIGGQCRIRMDGDGKAHILYHDSINGVFRYASNRSGKWVVEVPDSKPGSGGYPALVVGAGGVADIFYPSNGLRHAARDKSGAWLVESLDNRPAAGPSAVRVGNTWHAIWRAGTGNSTELVHATQAGAKWVLGAIDKGSSVGSTNATSLAQDKAGHLHLVYRRSNRVWYATEKFGKWSLVQAGYSNGLHQGSSLRVDDKGVVHHLHSGSSSRSLLYATYSYTNGVDDNCDGK